MSKIAIIGISSKFPWLHRLRHLESELAPTIGQRWVVLPDGRVGIVNHKKQDGKYGVRPIDAATGAFYLNPAQHWPESARKQIPEEVSLAEEELRDAEHHEIPKVFHAKGCK